MDEARNPARTFEEVAHRYDAVRPTYPASLVRDVLAFAALGPRGRILEIGCGPGKATLPFARGGHRVTALEPGAPLAAIARERTAGLDVEVVEATFESAALPDAAFDLVIAGQAYHWVQPEADARLARVLRDGGSVALFGNHPRPLGGALGEAVQGAYRREAPELVGIAAPGGRRAARAGPEARLAATRAFAAPEWRRHPWEARYPTARYLALLDTQSDHRLLAPDVRARLFDALARAVDAHGGVLSVVYDANLLLARRLPRAGVRPAPGPASPRGAGA